MFRWSDSPLSKNPANAKDLHVYELCRTIAKKEVPRSQWDQLIDPDVRSDKLWWELTKCDQGGDLEVAFCPLGPGAGRLLGLSTSSCCCGGGCCWLYTFKLMTRLATVTLVESTIETLNKFRTKFCDYKGANQQKSYLSSSLADKPALVFPADPLR